ncbi:hypothetical protein NA57DRAFT_68225 [Rhizodiscina lignyota]|uniref:Cation efflux protein transmembrane domain-containing protein n=1 Tax=Rhizodiscina lignyota TaxID=1504668 RepID=A0A9P4I7B0_9PEZI|nr:hypothetical protein NA57DRAFT_68225 [Rhizodiscina lignyota]
MAPEMRSQRLIGNSNPRYRWEQYWKTEEELKAMKKPIRKYYERNNELIQQYTFIDKLLDSSLPHDLIQEYHNAAISASLPNIPETITEEAASPQPMPGTPISPNGKPLTFYILTSYAPFEKYGNDLENPSPTPPMPDWEPEEEADSNSRIVSVAIFINLVANTVLLVLKIIVTLMTSSVSVLASMVDAALDFLSTAIVFITTRIISRKSAHDKEKYPVGRRRLEPIGVLVFSVIMVTAFVQVALEGLGRLTSGRKEAVQLSPSAIAIMSSTVVIKGLCWLWCKAIKNSSVQALAQDAMTDVVFNVFSIIFPLIGYYADIWFLDPVGGILLSGYVILNWSFTCSFHISQLTGAAASADQRNVLLYLTMRFAKTIKHIQGLTAYHAGDKLNVEVDVVLDENMSLRDSHDLGESLQYVLESVPYVDRAFVHADYARYNSSERQH